MVVSGLTAVVAVGVTVTAGSGTVATIGVGATAELTDAAGSERTVGVTDAPVLITAVDVGSAAGLAGCVEADADSAGACGVDPTPVLLSVKPEPDESVMPAP